MYHARHRKTSSRGRLRAMTVALALGASTLAAPVAAPVVSAHAALSPSPAIDLSQFLVVDGRSRYAGEIAGLIDRARSQHVTMNAAAINVYAVPTVEGVTHFITDQPAKFRVTPNPARTMTVPGDSAAEYQGPGEVTAVGGGRLTVHMPVDATTELMTSCADVMRIATQLYHSVNGVAGLLQDGWAGNCGNPNPPTASPSPITIDVLPRPVTLDVNKVIGLLQALRQAVSDMADNVVAYVKPGAITGLPGAGTALAYLDWLKAQIDPLIQKVIDSVNVPPPAQPLVDQIEALVNSIDPSRLNDIDPELMVAQTFDVVPLAAIMKPVNSTDSLTAQPGWQTGNALSGGALGTTTPTAQAADGIRGKADDEKPEWIHSPDNEACFDSITNAWWRKDCWAGDYQAYDGSSDYSFYQLRLEGSSYPKEGRGMKRLWVEAAPHTSSTQWFDGGKLPVPNADLGGQDNCATTSQSISYSGGSPIQVGFSQSLSYETCELYRPKGYDDDGHWAHTWYFNRDRDPNGVHQTDPDAPAPMRHVAFTMGVRTKATDNSPAWELRTGTEVTTNHWYGSN